MINLMKPKINKTSEYIEIVGHYDDSILCAKLTLLADLYAVEHRYGYAKFRIEDEDKLDLVNEKLDYPGQLYIYSNNGQTLLTHLDYGPFTSLTCTITSTGTNEDDMGQNYTYSGSQTFLGFSITANATVPDSDLEVGDSFRLDENKTVYIVEGSSVTDLTGTKWQINSITCSKGYGQFNTKIILNGSSHENDGNLYVGYVLVGPEGRQHLLEAPDRVLIYNLSSDLSVGDVIEFTGGTDATNTYLIAWLQDNATQIIEPEITDLTGTKWIFNDEVNDVSHDNSFAINFISNNVNYTRLGTGGTSIVYWENNDAFVRVYDSGIEPPFVAGWKDDAYKTIEISGGTDATNTNLISWLQANATQIHPTYTLSTITDNCTITNLSFTLVPNSGYKLPSSISVTNATLVSYNSTSGEVVLSGVSDNTSVDVEFLITFMIDSMSHQAEQGMTWAEWCDSEYNTNGYTVSGNSIVQSSAMINNVVSTDVIISGHTYTTSASGGAGGN